MFWHLGKFFESDGLTNWQNRWKASTSLKTLDPTNLISLRKSRHATRKTSKLQNNRSSWSKKSQLEANEILEFHTKVFQQADLLPQSTYLRDTSIHCFFDLNSISTRAPSGVICMSQNWRFLSKRSMSYCWSGWWKKESMKMIENPFSKSIL